MTRFKFFGFLLPLALGLAAAPAMADPRPHTHGGSEPATTFAVSLDILTSSEPSSGATQCDGTTDIQANTGLQANFSPGQNCTVSVAIDEEEFDLGPVLDLSLFSLEVKTKKSGTNLRLYFTTQLSWAPHTNPLQGETIYVTDRLVAVLTFNEAPNDFFLTLEGTDPLALTKLHQPERGAVTAEDITVGPFHYIADDP